MEVKVKGQATLFKNPILEKFTKTSPLKTWLTYGSMIISTYVLSITYFEMELSQSIVLFMSGFVVWTLVEYLMHRYVFHFIHENKWARRFHYLVHGVHHEYPKDKQRLFMPPVPGIILASILFLLFFIPLGTLTFAFFPGLISGYLFYVFTHYAIHSFRPKSKYQKFIWEHHNTHHFKYPDKAFGVSTPLWDYVFNTMPPKKVKKS